MFNKVVNEEVQIRKDVEFVFLSVLIGKVLKLKGIMLFYFGEGVKIVDQNIVESVSKMMDIKEKINLIDLLNWFQFLFEFIDKILFCMKWIILVILNFVIRVYNSFFFKKSIVSFLGFNVNLNVGCFGFMKG